MSFFDRLQQATEQERNELFNLPIIRDALQGDVSLKVTGAFWHRPITTCAIPCH